MKIKRELSGIFFRVERNGKWDNVCFEDLEYDEQLKVIEGRDIPWLIQLSQTLADTVNRLGNTFDIYSKYTSDE